MDNTDKDLKQSELTHSRFSRTTGIFITGFLLVLTSMGLASIAQAMEYQTIDGYNNNRARPFLGQAGQPLLKQIKPDTRREPGGKIERKLKSSREISNLVSAQGNKNTRNRKGLSDLFWMWGQFLDHDITLTPVDEAQGVAANIAVPANDQFFRPGSTIAFTRSEQHKGNQLNAITAFIDASNVYGSDTETATQLRAFRNGLLKTSAGNLLPLQEGEFIAGDERVNEHAGLTAMHTLWMREHNRIARQLKKKHRRWNDERLYQEARRWVIAEMQAITYNEFLPRLLGKNALFPYLGYEARYTPNIINSFTSAAYRFGHSMLSPNLLMINQQGRVTTLPLRNAFFNPENITRNGIDVFLRGAESQTAQALDPLIVDDVRNFLFGAPGAGGFDLVALNIQRGRDHALANYNKVRKSLRLRNVNARFKDGIFRKGFASKLRKAYGRTHKADLWVAGLAEKPVRGGLVGETFHAILVYQFEALRDADRFWYEKKFRNQDLRNLKQLRLADVIKRNTAIKRIKGSAMDASNSHTATPRAQEGFSESPVTPPMLDSQQIERIKKAVQQGNFG